MLLRIVIAIIAVFTSCSTRRAPVPARVSASHPEYIDLEAGWRLRVVTPISKRGNYRLNYKDVKQADGTITLTTDEFRGYETAYYSVEARKVAEFRSGLSPPNSHKMVSPQPSLRAFDRSLRPHGSSV